MIIYPYYSGVVTDDGGKTLSFKWSGYLGFFCKECFYPHIFQSSGQITMTLDQKDKDGYPFSSLSGHPRFCYKCPRCHKVVEWDCWIDPNIVESIAILNRKGYETTYCCEGHDQDMFALQTEDDGSNPRVGNISCYSSPYITFKIDMQREICELLPPLGSWKLDPIKKNNDFKFSISVDEQYRNLATNMSWLKRWVDCLPCVDYEIHPEFITEYVKKKYIAAQKPLTDDEQTICYFKEEGD